MSSIRKIVIAGAGLAGLRAAEALRAQGFEGTLTVVGEEDHEPYDRPPLSKQVVLGMIPATHVALPRDGDCDIDWRLGARATNLDLRAKTIEVNGEHMGFDRLLVATGSRARPWREPTQAALTGVLTLRTIEDGAALRDALADGPAHTVVIGGGFTGCEIASACRALGLAVTVVERNATPLASALGLHIGEAAARLMRHHGVDLRCGARVERIYGDGSGHVAGVALDDGSRIAANLVVVALGSLPNSDWLNGSGLAVGPRGLACDAACRAFDPFGIAGDAVFAAGDVARFPHPLFNYEFMTLEHWGNAVEMARVAAHNMLAGPGELRPHVYVPAFWSSQFDVSIKSVGVPAAGDRVAITMGSIESGSFVASYGRGNRLVAMVGFDQGKWMAGGADRIRAGTAFPPPSGLDAPDDAGSCDPGFATPAAGLSSYITLSGHLPGESDLVRHLAEIETPAPAKEVP